MGKLSCTHLMGFKHLEIHTLIGFRVIEDPHNDIHDLGLYGREKVISGELAMLVLSHHVS